MSLCGGLITIRNPQELRTGFRDTNSDVSSTQFYPTLPWGRVTCFLGFLESFLSISSALDKGVSKLLHLLQECLAILHISNIQIQVFNVISTPEHKLTKQ